MAGTELDIRGARTSDKLVINSLLHLPVLDLENDDLDSSSIELDDDEIFIPIRRDQNHNEEREELKESSP
jgi:hypothetical protein